MTDVLDLKLCCLQPWPSSHTFLHTSAGDRLAAKSSDGRIHIWTLHTSPPTPSTSLVPALHQIASFRLTGGGGGRSNASSAASGVGPRGPLFGATSDGAFLCVGTVSGEVGMSVLDEERSVFLCDLLTSTFTLNVGYPESIGGHPRRRVGGEGCHRLRAEGG